MRIPMRLLCLVVALFGLVLCGAWHGPLVAQDKVSATAHAWTFEEAMQQLRLYPRDPYLQYVALQLARRGGRTDDAGSRIEQMIWADDNMVRGPNERARRVDLFSLFSGALAVQESLQLDAMRGQRSRPKGAAVPPKSADPQAQLTTETRSKAENVKVASLIGPTIKSHPWEKMLAGKKPAIGQMARCVPEDFYLIEFRSLVKMLEVMDRSDLWSTHVFSQASQEARTQLVGQRLQKQLAVETTQILRPFYDLVVEEVAVTGSDLFLREGSDVTLLFRSKQSDVLKTRMNGFLANAEKANPDARRTTGDYLGVPFVHLASPDRTIHVFSAYPTPELHVRSNSRVAFQRIIEAIQGKSAAGKAVRRLGDTEEFAYIRTLMPRGAQEEDGFVYLSDPFIRRLVGPEVKLTERRRMLCYNHLRMIGHAALMYRTEHGKAPASLEELAKAGCAPGAFGQGELACPDGGRYTLSADGLRGACSHHGHALALTPCGEIPLKEATAEEADEYKAFREEYNQYWRTYFDPIALRIQITPERYRLETIVLPLMDNSIYTRLAGVLGGRPESLNLLPVPKRNIFSLAVRVNKRELFRMAELDELLDESKQDDKAKPGQDALPEANRLKELGLALHAYHDQFGHLPTAVCFDKQGKKTRLSWRVHLLPYLEQGALYREFRLDEPWDSAHNKQLIAKMPEIYRPANPKLAAAGRTKCVAPVGEQTVFSNKNVKIRMSDITDGTSLTLLLVEADDDHAVVWTAPDDLEIDLKKPLNGLAMRPPGAFLTLFADGSVHFLRETIDAKTVAAMLTMQGGEVVEIRPADEIALFTRSGRAPLGFRPDFVDRLKLGTFLARGIGNQAGLHVYDAEPLFDFNLPNFLGMAMGSFNGRPGPFGNEALIIGTLIASLNAPVYISVPVQDAKVVDEFLVRLDGFLAEQAREKEPVGGFFRVEQDFYHLPGGQGKNIRAYSFRFGPLKWRFFWARIGNGLYIASRPYILEDILALESGKANPVTAQRGPQAHAMVRLRPQHWNRVLSDYRLGWAENNRAACLHNLGPLSSLSRGMTAGKPASSAAALEQELRRLSALVYGVHFFCPEEGRYRVAPDGKAVTCSVHGSATAPRQPAVPSEKSSLGRLLHEFADMTLALTFMEDGLHAVVTIERK
jgi:Protein of unknown function (DUF1559)